MPSETLTETGILLGLRAVIFFSCRKYLLRSLYSDLQDLSGVETASISTRDPLPSPITQTARESVRKPQGRTETIYSALSSNVFAGCFSESCMLFLLLMLQGLSVFSARTRLLNWRLSLFLLLTCILVLIPFLLSLLLTAPPDSAPRPRSAAPRLVFSVLCVALYLFLLSCIPLPPALAAADRMTATLSRLVVLGTIVLGLLAGFGAVSSSWAFLPSRHPLTTPTEQDIVTAEYALSSVRDDLDQRRSEAARRAAAQQTDTSWVSRVMPSFRGDEHAQELRGLEALEHQMARALEQLRARRAAGRYAGTLRGRLATAGGRLFALYCVFRFASSLANVLAPAFPPTDTTSSPDTETTRSSSLDALAAWLRADGRHVGLVLVGVIILSSIRRVLRGVTRVRALLPHALLLRPPPTVFPAPSPGSSLVPRPLGYPLAASLAPSTPSHTDTSLTTDATQALRVTSRHLGASLMLLLVAQLMVIYLLSTIVQLRASFPPPPPAPSPFPPSPVPDAGAPGAPGAPDAPGGAPGREGGAATGGDGTENLFATIPAFTVFGALFDWAFVLAAGGSLVGRWAAERVK
ncbi:Abscisic acid G-protein coupled receptor-domain-containing protein [Mycena rosella]|uniref:Abscisic acid G-protein coupled receptor-domain-containing protein n=1 Tax=Mycena rosella TaxID=1033263 RepID=A0AAD7GS50_MYCRO|nr:Abscisic acid G-protein coupled receptor-domain-containing protein [Mycena rosella]